MRKMRRLLLKKLKITIFNSNFIKFFLSYIIYHSHCKFELAGFGSTLCRFYSFSISSFLLMDGSMLLSVKGEESGKMFNNFMNF